MRPRWQAGHSITDDDIEAAKAMLANPDIGVTQIAHRLGVSRATLYRISLRHEPRIPPEFKTPLCNPTMRAVNQV
jgi:transposase-like protein